jgi:hypothetical protein
VNDVIGGASAGEELGPADRRAARTITRRSLVRGLGLTLALLVLGICWALSSPVGSSPDDDFHMGSIWCSDVLRQHPCEPTETPPESGQRYVRVPVALSSETIACFAFKPSESAACTTPIVERGGLGASRANDGAYPNGFYAFMSLFVFGASGRSVVLLRVISWMLCVGLIAASVLVSQRTARRPEVVAVAVTSVPLMLFVFASVNPSGVTIAGCTAYVFSGIAALTASETNAWRRAAIVAVLSALCALASRPDAGVWLGLGSVTIVLFAVTSRARITPRLLLPIITALVAGMYFLVLGGSSAVQSGIVETATDRSFGDTWFTNVTEITSLWAGAFGTWGLGWLDTTMPTLVWFCSLSAAVGVVVVGLGTIDRRRFGVLGWQLVVMVVVPLYLLTADDAMVGETVQPRYLLPAIPAAVAVVLLHRPGARAREILTGAQPYVIGALVALANSIALHTNLRRYVSGVDRAGFDLDHGREWWWGQAPSPMLCWLAGSLAGAVVLTLLLTPAEPANREAGPHSGIPDGDLPSLGRTEGADPATTSPAATPSP